MSSSDAGRSIVAVRPFSRPSAWGYSTWRSGSGSTIRRSPTAGTCACPTSSTRPCDESGEGESRSPSPHDWPRRECETCLLFSDEGGGPVTPGSTLIADRPGAATTGAERILAEVLADVLRTDRVSVESHFFEELGADSLVMAHFCARVRKRGDLPSVSMRDIYRYPTIRSLAKALADVAPSAKPAAAGALEPPTPTTTREYVLCGALQVLFYLGYSYLGVIATIEGYQWMVAGSQGVESYLRLILLSGVAFLVVCAVPIAGKWLLIGRWKPQQIRVWSLAYVRFWIVKTLIRSNPGVHLFVGSPLYGLYLRALGAKNGPRVVILSRDIPVCTDLLTIGAGTVIRRESIFLCYRAQAGRIEIGPVTLGRDVFVGEKAVLDINTSMGDGAQLGHASSLHSGQSVPAGERWHGSPAGRTEVNYVRVAPARCSSLRRAIYGALTLIRILFL